MKITALVGIASLATGAFAGWWLPLHPDIP